VDEIARRAGVGMGTLYRHFPTKHALIDAIVDARFEELTACAQQALQHADPWEGLATFLDTAVTLQAGDRGFKDALAARGRDEKGVKAARRRLHAAMGDLLERGQAAGVVRPDLAVADLVVLLWATARIVERTPETAPAQARRFVVLHLQGLRADAAVPSPDIEPMTPRQLGRSISRPS
jgi:AcrR family transcriptional regulator